MGLSTFQELKVSIADWCKRGDIQSRVVDFIALAESDIWEQLRVREMEYRTTLSTSTSTRFVALPDDYIKMRQLQITVDDELYDLDQEPLKSMTVFSAAGIPTRYTVTSQIEMNCVSDQVYTLEIDYFRELTPLSNDAPTNDILTKYPQIYLAGSLVYAFRWAKKNDDAEFWQIKFDQAIAKANRKSRNGRFGPAPAMTAAKGMVI